MNVRWPENEALRSQREKRGWSHGQAASELRALARRLDEPEPAADANLVWRWEAGVQQPGPYYRRFLCLLYGRPPDRLGLAPVKRRKFLQYMAALTLAPPPLAEALGGQAAAVLSGPGARSLNPDTVEAFEGLTRYYHQLYRTVPAPQLIQPVAGHVQFGLDLLRSARPAVGRRRLAASTALAGLGAGRILAFDLRLTEPARRYYGTAAVMAEQAEDHLLAAAISGHMAFVPGFARRAAEANGYVIKARQQAGDEITPTMAAWLFSASTEVFAICGDSESSLTALGQAETALGHPGPRDDPEWQDWFSPAQFDSFKGYALLRAGHPRAANAALQAALGGLHTSSAEKQEAVVLADLADSHVALRNVDEACRLLIEAAVLAWRTGYITASERVHAVRHGLTQWDRELAVKDLDEALRGLGASHSVV